MFCLFRYLLRFPSQVSDLFLQPGNFLVFGGHQLIRCFSGDIAVRKDLQDFGQFYSFSFFTDSYFSLSFSKSFSNKSITSSIGK